MNAPNKVSARPWLTGHNLTPGEAPQLSRWFAASVLALIVGFSWPLYQLVRFSISSELYSYIVLVPFISAYLTWMQRKSLPAPMVPGRMLGACLLLAGALLLAGYGAFRFTGTKLAPADSLALTTLSFLLCFFGVCFWHLGSMALRALAFPLGFLIFMIPLPVGFQHGIETLLQYGSAAVALILFKLAWTAVFYVDLNFKLPGITLQVAPECSGIHSSLALFITSLLAGWFFLRSPGRRAILALAVIPLAFLRNGFRIFVIGELCTHIGPHMINSPIHHHGGPLFFALSLVPFFLLLRFLCKADALDKNLPSKLPGK